MWRDELNVYGIAAASPSFRSLLWHVHHEAHPLRWYLIIWIAIKVFPSVLVLKVVQLLVGAGIILMISLKSPFSRSERVLILLSYFILFEYTVMSRMYGLCVLITLVFLWTSVYWPDRLILNAVLLGVLANTDTFGLLLSGAFGLGYVINRYRERVDKPVVLRHLTAAAAIYIAMVACWYFTVKPPSDISWRTTGRIFRQGFELSHLAAVAVECLALPWFPIRFSAPLAPGHFWNPNAVDHPALYAGLMLLVVGAYFLTFRRDRDLLAVFAMASLGAVAFAFFIYTGNMRNWGITFVAYVAALWLQRLRRPEIPAISTVLLACSAASGVIFSALMWTRPFSSAEATAAWLKSNHLQDAAIVGTPDTTAAAVATLLGRPIYFLDCRCSDSYLLFSSRRDDYDEKEFANYTLEAFDKLHSEQLILLLGARIRASDRAYIHDHGASVAPLVHFTGAEAPEEDFYVYRVSRRAVSPSRSAGRCGPLRALCAGFPALLETRDSSPSEFPPRRMPPPRG